VAALAVIPVFIVEGRPGPVRASALAELLDGYANLRPAAVVLESALAGQPEIAASADLSVHVHTFGCPCCTGSLPLVVSLGRILRRERPKLLVIGIVSGSHRKSLERLLAERFGENLALGVFCHKSVDVAQGLLSNH
jgi:hypothetical protein